MGVLDFGAVARLGEDRVRWTAADPNVRWLLEHARGLNVSVEDVTEQVLSHGIPVSNEGFLPKVHRPVPVVRAPDGYGLLPKVRAVLRGQEVL